MNKKWITITACAVALAVGAIVFGRQGPGTVPAQDRRKPDRQQPSTPIVVIPEHVFYGEVFGLLVAMKNSADYQNQAGLSREETGVLERTAQECENEVGRQDARAKIIIDGFRSKTRRRLLPGETLPPPPPEIKGLQEERDTIILRCRDRLRAALGEEKFARFNEAAHRIVHIGVTTTPRRLP